MSIQLLTTCQPDAMRGAATATTNWVDNLSEEFTPLNLRALALLESDWDGEASLEFEEAWIEFRTGCGILVGVMRDAAAIVIKLADALALAQRQFNSAVDEAEATGLIVDLSTGEVSPPPIVLSPEPPFPVGSREVEVADQVHRAELRIQDAAREATAADQRAGEELAALKPRVDLLVPILRNLGVAIEGYGGIASGIAGVANGVARGGPSVGAQGWQRMANNPIVGAANSPIYRAIPVMRHIPGLNVVATLMTWTQLVQEGEEPARAATRAIVSNAATFALGVGIGAGVTAAAAASPSLASGTPGVVLVAGAFVIGAIASPATQRLGDEIGQEIHDHLVSPAAYGIKGAWNHVFG